MVTERRVIVEKRSWVPVQFDDGTNIVVAILLVAGLGLIAYALFGMPRENELMRIQTPSGELSVTTTQDVN